MSTEIAVSAVVHASSDDQLIELWLHERSPHTQRAYRADVQRFRARAGKPLHAVTLADLQNFAKSMKEGAEASRYRTLSAVKSLLAFGHRLGYLLFDVGRALRLPSVRNRLNERILSEADLHRIISLEPNPRNRAILTLLYASGVRVSELCALDRFNCPLPFGNLCWALGRRTVLRTIPCSALARQKVGAFCSQSPC